MSFRRTDNRRHEVGLVKYLIGRAWLGLFGWKVTGEVPPGNKFVLVGAPHTSNWDFPFAIAASFVFGIRIHWMGKDSLFRWPWGWFMRMLGGIPIDRKHAHGVVYSIANEFKQRDHLIVVIAAKGTRKKTDYWKSGFYWIAHTANVPVLCSYMDYKNRRVDIGLSFMLTGDVKQDMDRLREYFSAMHGRHPELEDNIRLREETQD